MRRSLQAPRAGQDGTTQNRRDHCERRPQPADLVNAAPGAGAVVIAIVAFGRPGEVAACIAALMQSSFPQFEIVVVENAGVAAFELLCATLAASDTEVCDGGTLSDPRRAGGRCMAWRQYRLATGQRTTVLAASENLGYASGVNLALRSLERAPGWCGLWILNPDTEPARDALLHVIAHARRGSYGLIGSRLIEDRVKMCGGRWRRLIGRGRLLEDAVEPVDSAAVERRLHWVSGAAVYASREFIESVGPLEESYFLYCEDVDWSLRRGRFRLGYAHQSIIRHAHGTSIGSASTIRARSRLAVYLESRNALLLTRLRFPRLLPIVVLITLILLPDFLLRGDRERFAAACRGWWAGVRDERGRPSWYDRPDLG
jgi:N-acetylglucosaminyl-diphospho-decaprenol L-rhamnosyltransferase